MAVLARTATYEEFCHYTQLHRGTLPRVELDELWKWRQKLLSLSVSTGSGYRSQLPPDEQHLTREQRGRKAEQEAKSEGRNIERLPEKVYF